MTIAVSKTIVTSKVIQRVPKLGPELEDAPWVYRYIIPAGARWVIPKGIWKAITNAGVAYKKLSVYDSGTGTWVNSYSAGYSHALLISDGAKVAILNPSSYNLGQGLLRIYPYKLPDFTFGPLTSAGSRSFYPSDFGYAYVIICTNSDGRVAINFLCNSDVCYDYPAPEGGGFISYYGYVGGYSYGGGEIKYMKSNIPIL